MADYLSVHDVEEMGEELMVYDVDQAGWEHEGKGLEFNLNHVLKELDRAERKDYFSPDVVRSELAPDTLQYALRIARWTGFRRDLILPRQEIKGYAAEQATLRRLGSRRLGAYAFGRLALAEHLHKLDHASERELAWHNKMEILPKVAQALTVFALDSAQEFDFQPRKAFTERLAYLRER